MRQTTRYYDEYKGFTIEAHVNGYDEVTMQKYDQKPWWTSYFYINKAQVTPEVWTQVLLTPEVSAFGGRERVFYNYPGTELLNSIPLHSGMTFYEPQVDAAKMEVWGVKVGCDYNHYWDGGKYYTLESVMADIKEAVDTFVSLTGTIPSPSN